METQLLDISSAIHKPDINENHIDTAGLLIAKTSFISGKSWRNQGEVKSGDLNWISASLDGMLNNSGTMSVENKFEFGGNDILINSGTIQANSISMSTPLGEIHNTSAGEIISQEDIPFMAYEIHNAGIISVAGKTPIPFKHPFQ